MIYLLNLNPAIDYYVNCDDFQLNHTNYSLSETVKAGGKATNVALVFNEFGLNTTMLGFYGGFSGRLIYDEIVKLDFVKNNLVDTNELSRINIKLNFEGETEINSLGPIIPEVFVKDLEKKLYELNNNDTLILSGRLANGMDPMWYLDIAKKCSKNGVNIVVDINDLSLLQILAYKPLLVKPNQDEIRHIFKHQGKLLTKDLYIYGKKMLAMGAKHVIISLGSEGSLFFFEDNIFRSFNIQRNLKSAVGSGDSMVAGFVLSYLRNENPILAYKFAQACGNATAFSDGIAKSSLIEDVLNEILIEEIRFP